MPVKSGSPTSPSVAAIITELNSRHLERVTKPTTIAEISDEEVMFSIIKAKEGDISLRNKMQLLNNHNVIESVLIALSVLLVQEMYGTKNLEELNKLYSHAKSIMQHKLFTNAKSIQDIKCAYELQKVELQPKSQPIKNDNNSVERRVVSVAGSSAAMFPKSDVSEKNSAQHVQYTDEKPEEKSSRFSCFGLCE